MSWFTKIFGQKQKRSPAELPEQPADKFSAAGNITNLAPNSIVPQSGLYCCRNCEAANHAQKRSSKEGTKQKGIYFKILAGVFAPIKLGDNEPITHRNYNAGEHFGECPQHKKITGWRLEKEEAPSVSSPVAKQVHQERPMMECTPFRGNTSCSDNECLCTYTTMPPAQGYLWIKPDVANTRIQCLSLTALHGYLTTSGLSRIDEIRRCCLPMVVCEEAAKRRNLDLEVASSDYSSWVNTGIVPCRATPLVSKSSPTDLKIGDEYGGGIIFYKDTIMRRNLIAAREDMPRLASELDEDCFSWFDATSACHALASNGFSDWFLPDKEQLHQLYLQKDTVGGFADDIYWSSTEYDENYAWTSGFGNGGQNGYSKDFSGRARAVRAVTY